MHGRRVQAVRAAQGLAWRDSAFAERNRRVAAGAGERADIQNADTRRPPKLLVADDRLVAVRATGIASRKRLTRDESKTDSPDRNASDRTRGRAATGPAINAGASRLPWAASRRGRRAPRRRRCRRRRPRTRSPSSRRRRSGRARPPAPTRRAGRSPRASDARSAPPARSRACGSACSPVAAGISLPMITFSFRPSRRSVLPSSAASVRTLVVSWNEAADRNESVASEALVMPRMISADLRLLLLRLLELRVHLPRSRGGRRTGPGR